MTNLSQIDILTKTNMHYILVMEIIILYIFYETKGVKVNHIFSKTLNFSSPHYNPPNCSDKTVLGSSWMYDIFYMALIYGNRKALLWREGIIGY